MKKTILTLALAGVLTIGGTVLAFANESVETGGIREANKVTKVQELVNSGMSVEDAKSQMMNEKFDRIDEAVINGDMTEEDGNALMARIKERSEICTAFGEGKIDGEGLGLEICKGNGKGNGMKLRNGSCR